MGHHIITASGMRFPFQRPEPHHLRLDDIVIGLAQTNRYSGQRIFPMPVAAHSIAVADLINNREKARGAERADPVLRLAALLHDAAEAYIGDVARPLREALQTETCMFEDWECNILDALADRLGLAREIFQHEAIKAADREIVLQEIGSIVRGSVDVIAQAKAAGEDTTDRADVTSLKPADYGLDEFSDWPAREDMLPAVLLSATFTPTSAAMYFILELESIARALEGVDQAVADRLNEMLEDAGKRDPLFIKSNRKRITASMNTCVSMPVSARHDIEHAVYGVALILTAPRGRANKVSNIAALAANEFAETGYEAIGAAVALHARGLIDHALAEEDPLRALIQAANDQAVATARADQAPEPNARGSRSKH